MQRETKEQVIQLVHTNEYHIITENYGRLC